MDKETTTSVTIDRKTFARLDRLAKSNNVSKKDFLSCALEYFEKYGINPVEHESPAKEMQKLIKRCDQVIAFIRKQEQDFLRPACEAMGSTSMRVTMSMDSILTEKSSANTKGIMTFSCVTLQALPGQGNRLWTGRKRQSVSRGICF